MDRPPLYEVMRQALDARAAQIRTAIPAEVLAYNHLSQTADVVPTVWTDGEEPPVVPSVMVLWPRGDGHYVHMPLHARDWKGHGDYGLLIACESDIAEWRRTAEAGPPADVARHHLQSAIFIPGIGPTGDTLYPPPDNTSLIISGGPVRIGDPSATKAVVHEDLLAAMDTFLALLDTWAGTTAHANWAAATATFAAAVRPSLIVLRNGLTGGDYQSPTVFVED